MDSGENVSLQEPPRRTRQLGFRANREVNSTAKEQVAATEKGKDATESAVVTLLPNAAAVFVAYLVVGIALPVLPLHVSQVLSLGPFSVGLAVGIQFAAALLTRMWAGNYADSQGSKRAVVIGLLTASVSGVLQFASLFFLASPLVSFGVLLFGRAILGASESFIVTGTLSWSLGKMGPHQSGKVMSVIGTALYAALAVGAPLGTALYVGSGFMGIALVTAIVSLVAIAVVVPQQALQPQASPGTSFLKVAKAVLVPGIALSLSGVGFGAITAFVALLFESRGWGSAWVAFTLLSSAFIVGRLMFGHLPDRIGGAKVALACVLIEAVSQVMIWCAPSAAVAIIGVTLTGLGYSLVFPGLGVVALQRVPRENRGLAMGAFASFLDLSLGLTGPVLGLVASVTGLEQVYLLSAGAALLSFGIVLALARQKPLQELPRAQTAPQCKVSQPEY